MSTKSLVEIVPSGHLCTKRILVVLWNISCITRNCLIKRWKSTLWDFSCLEWIMRQHKQKSLHLHVVCEQQGHRSAYAFCTVITDFISVYSIVRDLEYMENSYGTSTATWLRRPSQICVVAYGTRSCFICCTKLILFLCHATEAIL